MVGRKRRADAGKAAPTSSVFREQATADDDDVEDTVLEQRFASKQAYVAPAKKDLETIFERERRGMSAHETLTIGKHKSKREIEAYAFWTEDQEKTKKRKQMVTKLYKGRKKEQKKVQPLTPNREMNLIELIQNKDDLNDTLDSSLTPDLELDPAESWLLEHSSPSPASPPPQSLLHPSALAAAAAADGDAAAHSSAFASAAAAAAAPSPSPSPSSSSTAVESVSSRSTPEVATAAVSVSAEVAATASPPWPTPPAPAPESVTSSRGRRGRRRRSSMLLLAPTDHNGEHQEKVKDYDKENDHGTGVSAAEDEIRASRLTAAAAAATARLEDLDRCDEDSGEFARSFDKQSLVAPSPGAGALSPAAAAGGAAFVGLTKSAEDILRQIEEADKLGGIVGAVSLMKKHGNAGASNGRIKIRRSSRLFRNAEQASASHNGGTLGSVFEEINAEDFKQRRNSRLGRRSGFCQPRENSRSGSGREENSRSGGGGGREENSRSGGGGGREENSRSGGGGGREENAIQKIVATNSDCKLDNQTTDKLTSDVLKDIGNSTTSIS